MGVSHGVSLGGKGSALSRIFLIVPGGKCAPLIPLAYGTVAYGTLGSFATRVGHRSARRGAARCDTVRYCSVRYAESMRVYIDLLGTRHGLGFRV